MPLDVFEPSLHLYNNHVNNTIKNDILDKDRNQRREQQISSLLANVGNIPDRSRLYDHSNNPLASYLNDLENNGNLRNNFQELRHNNSLISYSREDYNKPADSLNYPRFTASQYPVYKRLKDVNKIPRPVNIPEFRIPDKNKTGTYASMLREWRNAQMNFDTNSDHLRKGYIIKNPDVQPRQTEAEASLGRYYIMDPLKRDGERSLSAMTNSLFGVSVPKNNREKGSVIKRNLHVINPKFRDSENLEVDIARIRGYAQPLDTTHLDVNGRRPYQQVQTTTWRNENSRLSRPMNTHRYIARINNEWKPYTKPNEMQFLREGRRQNNRFEDLRLQNKNLQLSGVTLTKMYKVPFVSGNFSENELDYNYNGRDLNIHSSYPTIRKNDPVRSISRGIDVMNREKSFEEVNTTLRYVNNDNHILRVGKNRIIPSTQHQRNIPIHIVDRKNIVNNNLVPRLRNSLSSQSGNKNILSNLSQTLKGVFSSLPKNEPLKAN